MFFTCKKQFKALAFVSSSLIEQKRSKYLQSKLTLFKSGAGKCYLLLFFSILAVINLLTLNIYISFNIVDCFMGDGWSFLGGFILALSYLVTVPALVFSILSVSLIRKDSSRKHLIPNILGVLGTLCGLVLHNATQLWIYIVLSFILLLGASLLCGKAANNKDIGSTSEVKDNTK